MSGVATLQEEGFRRGCSAHAMPGQFELVLMSKAGPALYIYIYIYISVYR
jgi:hypothetical protein